MAVEQNSLVNILSATQSHGLSLIGEISAKDEKDRGKTDYFI
jgi:hypothetical protein